MTDFRRVNWGRAGNLRHGFFFGLAGAEPVATADFVAAMTIFEAVATDFDAVAE